MGLVLCKYTLDFTSCISCNIHTHFSFKTSCAELSDGRKGKWLSGGGECFVFLTLVS